MGCERLSLELDPASLELSLRARDGTTRIQGARPRVWITAGAQGALRARSVDSESVETPLGPATRLLVCSESGSGLELGLSLDMAADWPGVVLQLAVQNARSAPVQIDALEVLHWCGPEGELALPGDPRALRWLDPGAHGARPPVESRLRGRLCAESAANLRARGGGLTLGFLGWRAHAGRIELHARGRHPVRLSVRCQLGGVSLAPGESALGERVWVGLEGPGEDGLTRWAERAGRELDALRHRSVSAWCCGPRASARAALALARELRERQLEVGVIRLDQGFAAAPGDWLEPGPAFPGGLEPLARELRELGFSLGVRLAPFAAAHRSRLAREHPHRLLRAPARTAAGSVRVLDLAREDVRAGLEALGRGLTERGVDHLWLEELWLGLLPAGGPLRAAAYRQALEALRRGAGPAAFLAGLQAPFAASIGVLDALQLAPDGARSRWRPGSPPDPLALRAGFAGRLGTALAGPLALDSDDEASLRAAAIGAAICGASICFSGAPDRIAPPRWRLARRLLPPADLRPERLPGLEAALAVRGHDGSLLLALLRGAGRSLALESLGMSASVRAFDAWRGEELGSGDAALDLAAAGGRPAQLLRLVPADDSARLIGSTVHLTAGAAELRSLESRSDSLRVSLALPGRHQGTLFLQPAGKQPPLAVRISFDDALELDAAISKID